MDLATLERVFTVRRHDALTAACGPTLIAAVHQQAPGVRLRLPTEPGSDTPELRRGEVDLESSSTRPTLPGIRCRLIGEDRLVLAVRPGHPLADGPASADRYAAAEHVTVSRRGRLRDPIDDVPAGHGLERRVVAAGLTADTVLQPALHSDLVVSLPDAVTHAARDRLGLLTLPLPVQMPPSRSTWCGTSDSTTTAPTSGCASWSPEPPRHCFDRLLEEVAAGRWGPSLNRRRQ